MNSRCSWLLLVFSWLGLCSVGLADERPNIILIMADDMGRETLGCYGGTSYETPNIDRLAQTGLRFEHAYATPLCTNTRIQLMTGKYNNRNWLAFGLLSPGEKTFGHYLQEAGYRTCIAGKWQLTSYDPPNFPGGGARRGKGMHPRAAGFHEYCLWHTGHTENKGSRYADPVIDQNGTLLDGEGKYGPDIWTDYIRDFITRHQDEPFFVYYPMALPHWPFVPTPDSEEWEHRGRRLVEDLKHASEMIEYTDKVVGRIVDHVDALGLRENTIVLFYTDNGTDWRVTSRMGQRLVRGGKSFPNDPGTRVPLIARWPSRHHLSGKTSRALVDSTDFLPTLSSLAGNPPESSFGLDGQSFHQLLTGEGEPTRRWVYMHQDPRPGWDKDRFHLIRFVRNRRYKLYEDGRLFAMNQDPMEERPLFVWGDGQESRFARSRLQRVLDGMKPYPMFEPESMMQVELLGDPYVDYKFQQRFGEVVAEAETVHVPVDESWHAESEIPGFSGTGYLRALRDQPAHVRNGILQFRTKLASSGEWRIGVRHRRDHANPELESDFWLRVNNGPWLVCRSADENSIGKWSWSVAVDHPQEGERALADLTHMFRLASNSSTYGNNEPIVSIAPRSANFKIDRVVLYQADRMTAALDPQSPQSEYHPW